MRWRGIGNRWCKWGRYTHWKQAVWALLPGVQCGSSVWKVNLRSWVTTPVVSSSQTLMLQQFCCCHRLQQLWYWEWNSFGAQQQKNSLSDIYFLIPWVLQHVHKDLTWSDSKDWSLMEQYQKNGTVFFISPVLFFNSSESYIIHKTKSQCLKSKQVCNFLS